MIQQYGWRAAFFAGALGAIAGAALMVFATTAIPVQSGLTIKLAKRSALDFRPVFRNRNALAYVLAYGGHCWELFAFRAWLPTYLLFAWNQSHSGIAGTTTPDGRRLSSSSPFQQAS